MKRNYLSLAVAGSLTLALLAGCGGGSSSSVSPPNLTYRNVALASDGTNTGTQYDKSKLPFVNDGITDGADNYWTTSSVKGDDQVVLLFNRGKTVDKIVIFSNDTDFISKPVTKTLSVAQFLQGPWVDVALNPEDAKPKPVETTPTTGTTTNPPPPPKQACTGSPNLTPEVVPGKSITCKFSAPIHFQYLRIQINSPIPNSQYIREIEVWGKDAG